MVKVASWLDSAFFKAVWHGSIVLFTKSSINCSNLALLKVLTKCLGPEAVAVIYGKLISVDVVLDNSILAFSEASFNAIKYSLKLYIDEEVEFHLLHIVDNNGITVNLINGALIEDVYSGMIGVAKDNMYEFKERVNSISINRVHKFRFKVIFGDFIEVVNDYCVNQNIYMFIMGTTGTTRLKDVFLGSTATKIIHNVDIPILAIPKKVEYHSLDKIIFQELQINKFIKFSALIVRFSKNCEN